MRPGYKLTEVGVIPDDWNAVALGQFAQFRTGPFGSALHKSDYTNDGVPVINPMHILDGGIEPTRTMTVTESAARELSIFRLKAGEIVIGRRGDMGRCAVVQPYQEGWLCGTGSMIIRCEADIDAGFLQRVLASPPVIAAIEDASVGTTMINLNQGSLAALRIQFPPLSEQHAIAEAFNDVDGLLKVLDGIIAKTRDLKQAVMQQLLTGKTRLPGFSGEWEMKRLGDVATFHKGRGLPKSELSPYGSEPCIHYGELFTQYAEMIRETVSRTKPMSDAFRSVANDVLMPTSDVTPRGLAKASCVLANGIVLGGDILVIRTAPEQISGSFLSYVIRREEEQVLRLVTGTTVFHLYGTDMKKFTFRLPSLNEQRAIVAVLSDMDAEIAALEARRDKTRALKQAMMQELLTGRIRLVEPTAQVIPLAAAMKVETAKRSHNEHFNEAVVIATLAHRFAGEDYPLGRFRYTKLSYLLHRHAERNTEQYLRKAAGPYNPKTRYGGAEKIALAKGYVREHHSGKYEGFVAAANVAEAEGYFREWYGDEALVWLDQFRKTSNDDLELLTTVFGAIDEVARKGRAPSFKSVKQFIADDPEWRAKLQRPLFSDDNIVRAGRKYRDLFGDPPMPMPHT